MDNQNTGNYGKRPLWQWVLIYVVVGAVIYGLLYYFVLGKRTGSVYSPAPTTPAVTTSETSETSPSATVTATQDTITLTADGFSPKTLTIKAGTKVTWMNQSGAGATVNSSPHPTHTDYPPLNLGSLPDGGAVFLTFDKPGTYKYHNHLIPSQFGTIVVQ